MTGYGYFFTTIYHFGFECGVGSDKLSNFFKLIRMDTHMGSSPATIQRQLKKMELLLPIYGLLNYCKPSFQILVISTVNKIAAIYSVSNRDFICLRTPDESIRILFDPTTLTVS